MTWQVEQAHEPPHAPSISRSLACAMSSRLSPSLTVKVWWVLSLSTMVTWRSWPGLGGSRWPCWSAVVVVKDRETRCCFSGLVICLMGCVVREMVVRLWPSRRVVWRAADANDMLAPCGSWGMRGIVLVVVKSRKINCSGVVGGWQVSPLVVGVTKCHWLRLQISRRCMCIGACFVAFSNSCGSTSLLELRGIQS